MNSGRSSKKGRNGLGACPCCGYATIEGSGEYEICDICFWEDDGQDNADADENRRGPNHVSLTTGRTNFLTYGASDLKDLEHCRPPNDTDERLRHFELVSGIITER